MEIPIETIFGLKMRSTYNRVSKDVTKGQIEGNTLLQMGFDWIDIICTRKTKFIQNVCI